MLSLRPDPSVQKMLISTPSRLLGEYEVGLLLIAHAWDFHNPLLSVAVSESRLSRNTYVVVFQTAPMGQTVDGQSPTYPWVGEVICIYLAILFGKRFDNHGLLEGTGSFQLPNYSPFQWPIQPQLPQNSHSPRRDIDVPLNLVEVARIAPLLTDSTLDPRFLRFLQTAGRFYLQALQSLEQRPAIAYLNLITTGEVLSNYFDYDKDDLLDDDAKDILSQIAAASVDGPKLAKRIKSRLFQVKRRFLRVINELVSDPFFDQSEATKDFTRLKREDFSDRMGAAYDLRSQYVHTGIPFGRWVARSLVDEASELQVGRPVLEDKDFEKVLWKAPTYFGLERVMRYCLLRFIHRHGVPIDARLNDPPAESNARAAPTEAVRP